MPASTEKRNSDRLTEQIEQVQREAAGRSGLVAFAGGLPDPSLFPKQELGEAFYRALHRPSDALQYGWPEGEVELRTWIAERLAARGAHLHPEDIIVTNGAQQAITLSVQTLFGAAASMGVDRASYPGALGIFRSTGLELKSLTESASGYYVMPAIANPSGLVLSDDERRELLRRAHDEDAILIEDDAYAETRFDGQVTRPLVADAPERVVHVGTLSKVLCPGLRVGWIATRHPRFAQIMKNKQETDLQAAPLAQRIVIEYLANGRFEQHLSQIRQAYRRKANLLYEAARQALPQFHIAKPLGGFSLWLEHRGEGALDELSWLEAAVQHGVSFDPGPPFWSTPPRSPAIRLCYASVAEDQIEEGLARLVRSLREVGGSSATTGVSPRRAARPVRGV